MQSPEAEMVSRVLGIKDFLVLLGGSVVGQIVGSVDTLGAVNTAIGIPIGVVGSTKMVKNLFLKEFLMGFGIGMTNAGLAQFTDFIADGIDKNIYDSSAGKTKTIRQQIKEWLETLTKPSAPAPGGEGKVFVYERMPSLEETGYTF